MDLRKVKTMFPMGANNFDTFCENVSARCLNLVEEEVFGTHVFTYIDGEGVEQTGNKRVKIVLYDHNNNVYYDEELNPYIKETLPFKDTGVERIFDKDLVKSYPIYPYQQRHLTRRTLADKEYLTEANADYWLERFKTCYIWKRGEFSRNNSYFVTADGSYEFVPSSIINDDSGYFKYGAFGHREIKTFYSGSLRETIVLENGEERWVPRIVLRRPEMVLEEYDFTGYKKCNTCGKWYPEDKIEENGNCVLCNHPDVTVYSYHSFHNYHPIALENDSNPTVFFGAEIEQVKRGNTYDQSNKNLVHNYQDLYHLENDGSLHGGFEMISQPLTWDAWKANYERNKTLFQSLMDAGQISHESPLCGGHKHISKSAFKNQKALDRAVAIVYGLRYEMEMFGRRSMQNGYLYCYKHRDKYITQNNMYGDGHYSVSNHYDAINTEHRDTVEVRFFRGTLNVDTLYAEIEFCKNLVEVANDFSKTVVYFDDLIYGEFVPKYWEKRVGMNSEYRRHENFVDLRFYDYGTEIQFFEKYADAFLTLRDLRTDIKNINEMAQALNLDACKLDYDTQDAVNIDSFASILLARQNAQEDSSQGGE